MPTIHSLQMHASDPDDGRLHEHAIDSHTLHSRQALAAMASMVVAQLPLPPLPLCAVRGGEEAFCSSHDLLASAIAVQMCSEDGSDASAAASASESAAASAAACRVEHPDQAVLNKMARKAEVLQRLQQEIAAVVRSTGTGDEAVERCYAIFQQAFRDYMRFYPCSPDLRFRPLRDVDPRHAVCAQAVSHLKAISQLEERVVIVDSDRYVDLLRAYIRLLHSYQ